MSAMVKVGIVGDRNTDSPLHLATEAAILHAASSLSQAAEIRWLPTPHLADARSGSELQQFDGLWIAPGSPYQSMAGALNAIRAARENGIPLIGTCGGFQHIVIEYARDVLGFREAQHAEYDPYASALFISPLQCAVAGQILRISLKPGSRVARIYSATEAEEEYYCNFGLNPVYQNSIDEYCDMSGAPGLRIVGSDHTGEARILELRSHPFFVGTLFVPQTSSTPERPHPLIRAFVTAAGGDQV